MNTSGKGILILGLFLIAALNLSCTGHSEIKHMKYRELNAIKLENSVLKLIILPDKGANMASLVHKPSGRDWLWHNPKPYRLPEYDSLFHEFDLSGFDDCFPTVGRCHYPDGAWKGIAVPDHGEVWALPWDYKIEGQTARFWVHGVRFPYLMEKDISLAGNEVVISYKVINYAPQPLKLLWAAHPLVAVEPGMELQLPAGTSIKGDLSSLSIQTKQGKDKAVFLTIGDSASKIARKVFTDRLPEGWCAFYEPQTGDFLKFIFPKEKIPYVGIWINQGAFPSGERHFNAALEPTNAAVETLQIADKEGLLIPIPAKDTMEWNLTIVAGSNGD